MSYVGLPVITAMFPKPVETLQLAAPSKASNLSLNSTPLPLHSICTCMVMCVDGASFATCRENPSYHQAKIPQSRILIVDNTRVS